MKIILKIELLNRATILAVFFAAVERNLHYPDTKI